MATVAGDESKPKAVRLDAVGNMVQDSAALIAYAESMMELENELLVPAIAALVSESEQIGFNGKVLSRLGLLDSRLHLVHMKEAVWEAGDTAEQLLFETEIPSIPQMMIPRWKRNLYDPQTCVLDL
jgi:hypothetical protein